MTAKLCPHCIKPLLSEHEKYVGCCYVCRRYGLLLGVWPEKNGEKLMLPLTDEQIARLFNLCAEIAAIKQTMPAPPRGMDGELELARNLRASLSRHSDALVELSKLLEDAR